MLNKLQRDITAMNMVHGLGPRQIMSLLDGVRDTEELFHMSTSRLAEITGRAPKWAEDLRSVKTSREYLEELSYVEDEKIKLICCGDTTYPEALKNIYDPPPVLYCKGIIDRVDAGAIAIVGSRRCSSYGLQMAERLAFDLARQGITIVSGMARGIDTAAHRGALRAGGRTIAVLGSGFKQIYPPGAGQLARLIPENGVVMTEFQSEMAPLRVNFPRRNRIISGLSRGVVVVEAARKSGALITADFALDQGREIFAVPGRADFHTSDGTNRLIQNGAKLVAGAEDILEELGIETDERCQKYTGIKCPGGDHLSDEQKKVLDMLDRKMAVHVDKISESTGIDRSALVEVLLKMEIQNLVKPLLGSSYVRIQ